MEGEDVEAVKTKTEALSQVAMKLGEAMYRASQEEAAAGDGADAAEGAGANDASGAGDQENVVDADFEEVDDESTGKDKTA